MQDLVMTSLALAIVLGKSLDLALDLFESLAEALAQALAQDEALASTLTKALAQDLALLLTITLATDLFTKLDKIKTKRKGITNVQDYINRINAHDQTLTEILLTGQELDNATLTPLLKALADKQNNEVAERITRLGLSYNQFTSINLQGLGALTTLDLNHNQLTDIKLQGLGALRALFLNNNQLTSIHPQALVALTALFFDNNQLTTITKLMLNQLVINNPMLHADFNWQEFTLDKISNDTLTAHFQAQLPKLQDNNNRCQPIRSVLMGGTHTWKLPNELIRMVFDFLNENQHNEINTLNELFPEKQGTINHFDEASPEFQKMKTNYGDSLQQLENKARADANGMKMLLTHYHNCNKSTTNFHHLRNDKPLLIQKAKLSYQA